MIEIEQAVEKEKDRCLAWVQHARSVGEQDMRQLNHWIETDKWPDEMFKEEVWAD